MAVSIDRYFLLFSLIACICLGCSAVHHSASRVDGVEPHLLVGDSLMACNQYDDALEQYLLVVRRDSETTQGAEAAYKIASLYSTPGTSLSNDSAAVSWLKFLAKMNVAPQIRAHAGTHRMLLERISVVQQQLAAQQHLIDSVQSQSFKTSQDLSARDKHIAELEAQIKQLNEELKKIRDVDISISQKRRK